MIFATITIIKGNLTLENSIIFRNGRFYAAVHVDGGTFTMNGGEISGCIPDTLNLGAVAVKVSENGLFEMNDGKISGNSSVSTYGGTIIYIDGSKFIMNGGKISNNTACDTGVVYVYRSTFEMNGGEISGNTAELGGGVHTFSFDSAFIMNGGKISNNRAQNGGGVYLSAGNTFKMTGGEISNNTADLGSGVWEQPSSSSGFTSIGISGAPVISDGVYIRDRLSRQLSIIDDLQSGAKIVIEGSPVANQMQQGTGVAVYKGSSSLTETMANAFVSQDNALIGTVSGNNVVWSRNVLVDPTINGTTSGTDAIYLTAGYTKNYTKQYSISGNTQTVSISGNNTAKATVNSAGLLTIPTGLNVGTYTTTITAAHTNGKADMVITVIVGTDAKPTLTSFRAAYSSSGSTINLPPVRSGSLPTLTNSSMMVFEINIEASQNQKISEVNVVFADSDGSLKNKKIPATRIAGGKWIATDLNPNSELYRSGTLAVEVVREIGGSDESTATLLGINIDPSKKGDSILMPNDEVLSSDDDMPGYTSSAYIVGISSANGEVIVAKIIDNN